ncbi:MAG: diguanylate cyclase [Pseudomonadota bacterium]
MKKLSSAVEYSGNAVVITNKIGKIEYVNPSFTEITGYLSHEVIGKTSAILKVQRTNEIFIKNLWDTILSGKRWVNDIQNRKKNGELYWSRLSISPIFNDDNEIVNFVGVSEDISGLKKAHETMRHMAFYDALTGLPNRRLFFDRLKQTLERNKRNNTIAAILFLDLDKFKDVNDTLGHDSGDILLKEVALRLQLLLRASDTVARQGGDEFTMILDNIRKVDDVELLAQKIIQKLSEPMDLMGIETTITVSVGITLTSNDGNSVDQLLKNADLAMYESKKSGRNTYCFYK